MDAVGIEILPSSAEIIRVRESLVRTDKQRVAAGMDKFSKKRSWENAGKSVPFPHVRITRGAFPEEAERLLGRYLYEVERIKDNTFRQVLRFAAMCILESISFTRKDGQYLRWDSRSGRRAGGKPFNKGPIPAFTEAISAKLVQIARDLAGESDLFGTLPRTVNEGSVSLLVGSCLDILPTLRTSSFDGIVTSPPYCNRYDYTRTYALELAMLGVDEQGFRDLRQSLLTCTVENRAKSGLENRFPKPIFEQAVAAFDSQELLGHILEYLDACRENGSLNNTGIPRMVRNYFLEMTLVIAECARVLKPGAPLVMVNDNVRYQGANISVDLVMSALAERVGYDVEVIWVLPRGKGNSSQQMGEHGREELRKCVYVWRSKGQPASQPARRLASVRSGLQPV